MSYRVQPLGVDFIDEGLDEFALLRLFGYAFEIKWSCFGDETYQPIV